MPEQQPRLPKSERTKAAILDAARGLFARHGFERTTVRDIAAQAGIDPAMVIRYFGCKDALFAQAASIDLRLPDLKALPADARAARLVGHFLDLWEGEGGHGSGLAVLLRAAATNEAAAEQMRAAFAGQVVPALMAAMAPPARDASRRAGVVSMQLLGLALGRYVLRIPAIAALSRDEIVAAYAPPIDRVLRGR